MAYDLIYTDRITAKSTKSETDRLLIAQFGEGFLQIAEDGLNSSKDVWEIEVAPASGDMLTDINNFLDTVGADKWFWWIPLGETAFKKWRISKDSRRRIMLNTKKFVFRFKIEQAFDLGGVHDAFPLVGFAEFMVSNDNEFPVSNDNQFAVSS